MKIRRQSKMLVEPPSTATGDIAFNLIVFFLVCASVQPDTGKEQSIPSSETVEQEDKQEHVEVRIRRQVIVLNGDPIPLEQLPSMLIRKLPGKAAPDDQRIVVVSYDNDAPWEKYVKVSEIIDQAGGIVALQTEEEREVEIPENQ